MPLPLPDELLEDVLRRLPPHEPAELVRAALVSRRWCRLVSDPGFHRRFCEFHRRAPMLGMLCNHDDDDDEDDNQIDTARFVPTTAFCPPRTDFLDMRALDARHGRVLCVKGLSILTVWDPITNKVREFPFPIKKPVTWTAAVLCSAAGTCSHLDCHQGPFLVVFACTNKCGRIFVYTYSSDAATWSEPVSAQHYLFTSSTCSMGRTLVGNALYFGYDVMAYSSTALKYDLKLCQASLFQLPSSVSLESLPYSLLTTTEDGGLGLLTKDDSKLYMWSMKDTHDVDAIWERSVIIELKTVFPVDVDVTKLDVVGSADGVGIVFMMVDDDAVYTIDLKTNKVKKVYEGMAQNIIPYMSFYTPALKGTCTGEGPSVGHSSA